MHAGIAANKQQRPGFSKIAFIRYMPLHRRGGTASAAVDKSWCSLNPDTANDGRMGQLRVFMMPASTLAFGVGLRSCTCSVNYLPVLRAKRKVFHARRGLLRTAVCEAHPDR